MVEQRKTISGEKLIKTLSEQLLEVNDVLTQMIT